MGAVGRASGKLILYGEHAAVFGHPALGLSLPECTTVSLEDPGLPAWDVSSIASEDREGIRSILECLEKTLPPLASRRATVRVESGVARKAGFGSSAALCGAFARAALLLAGGPETPLDAARTWALAHEAERFFHGTPSGVDTGLALLGGTCILRPRPPSLPDPQRVPARGLHLVVGALPRDAGCAALVLGLGARVKSGDREAIDSINELGGISSRAAEVLSRGAPRVGEELGMLADSAMERLSVLGLSTPVMDRILRSARAAGARGAKLSGAGGGGAFFALAPDAAAAVHIIARLRSECAREGIVLASPLRLLTA